MPEWAPSQPSHASTPFYIILASLILLSVWVLTSKGHHTQPPKLSLEPSNVVVTHITYMFFQWLRQDSHACQTSDPVLSQLESVTLWSCTENVLYDLRGSTIPLFIEVQRLAKDHNVLKISRTLWHKPSNVSCFLQIQLSESCERKIWSTNMLQ